MSGERNTDKDYLNKDEMLEHIRVYRVKVQIAKEQGKPEPRISDAIGGFIIKLTTKLASRYNFFEYTYKDEMIADGIYDCIKAVKTFDPDKSNNPFGYFTTIAWRAFLRRIAKEKKMHETKLTLIKNSSSTYSVLEFDTDETYCEEGIERSLSLLES